MITFFKHSLKIATVQLIVIGVSSHSLITLQLKVLNLNVENKKKLRKKKKLVIFFTHDSLDWSRGSQYLLVFNLRRDPRYFEKASLHFKNSLKSWKKSVFFSFSVIFSHFSQFYDLETFSDPNLDWFVEIQNSGSVERRALLLFLFDSTFKRVVLNFFKN